MDITILAFGIVKDLFKGSSIELSFPKGSTVTTLQNELEKIYPELKKLKSYLIAVNNEYANNDYILQENDEIAIIPPVSGG